MEYDNNELVLACENGKEFVGKWRLEGEMLIWELQGHVYNLRSSDDLVSEIVNFLKAIGKRLYSCNLFLKGCLTCQSFVMSGMAREMGRGQRGVCVFHNKGVEICYLCESYKRRMQGEKPNNSGDTGAVENS